MKTTHRALLGDLIIALAISIAVVAPGRASGPPVYVRSYVVQGDTQNWAFSPTTADEWKQLQRELCDTGASRILATGDIVDAAEDPNEWARADAAYDVTDACGLPATLPAGNHDIDRYGTPDDFSSYDAFMRKRPLHRPIARSPTGHSWIDRLEPGYVVAVLPFIADAAEVSWVGNWLAANPSERALLIKHDAVDPATGLRIGPAQTLTVRFGSRIRGVIGGHFLPPDRVSAWSGNGSFTLFSNYQLGAVLGPRPEGLVTMLDHYLSTDTWCIRTINYLTGEMNRFEPARCL